MKRVLILLILLGITYFSISLFKKGQGTSLDSEIEKKAERQEGVLTDAGYKVAWEVISREERVHLLPNFEESLSSPEAIEKYSCRVLTNAGFYSKENKPMGLFISEGNTLSGTSENFLFNGFLNLDGEVAIETVSPRTSKNAVQAGPILVKDGVTQKLNLRSDKNARRVVAATTNEGELILAVFYNGNSVVQGPLLEEMPQTVLSFAEKRGFVLKEAINLDGGTASVFYSNNINLPELVKVGSFLCVK